MKLGAYILRLAASRFFGDMVCYAFDVSAFLSRFFTRCNSFYFDNIPVVTEIVRFSTIPDHDETKKKKEENWSSFQGAAPIERNNSRRAHRFFLLFFFLWTDVYGLRAKMWDFLFRATWRYFPSPSAASVRKAVPVFEEIRFVALLFSRKFPLPPFSAKWSLGVFATYVHVFKIKRPARSFFPQYW